ncbi:hypothetical protein SY88_15175 [Clostridiales bacterium PH28_bin88]|nr:hypothetical protein SY88_15175 [Clostridiales bacterium PH28_bin88]
MAQELAKLLSETGIGIHDEALAIIGLPPDEWPGVLDKLKQAPGFISACLDPEELTLVMTEKGWESIMAGFTSRKVQHGYRLITMDVVLEWSVVGFLAAITGVLAQQRIPCGVISAYSRDHLLVRQEHLEAAIKTIQGFLDKYQKIPTG